MLNACLRENRMTWHHETYIRAPFKVSGLHATISRPINGFLPFLLTLTTIIAGLLLPGIARAQSDQSIYADALANGWQNWSWATVNLSNTQPVQAGSASIAVNAGAWQALYLHHNAFDSSLYTGLTFWIHGGSTGGQLLQV